MRRILFLLALNSIACTFINSASAQSTSNLISGDFKEAGIEYFVRDLESKTGFHFYYDAAQLDSFRFSLQFKDLPFAKVLEQAFQNTDIKFSVDGEKNVFLSRVHEIKTTLPPDFFAARSKSGVRDKKLISAEPAIAVANSSRIQEATIENKLYEIGNKINTASKGNVNVAGYIKDATTGEPIVGAVIYSERGGSSVQSDQFGYYSLSIPAGRHTLYIQSLGKRDTRRQVMVHAEGKLNIDLQDQVISLKEVVISTQKATNINSVQMGVEKISIKTIKQVPTVFGEADILRVVLTLPGVKSVGEASTGFNVRGGAADQNLILFNDATIYNPSHFFGFFSSFNPEVVKTVELYKSSIPAQYGGRLASVLEIDSREGNKKNFSASAGIGLVTSRLTIEGPIIKDKTSFILGGRTTYANWLMQYLPQEFRKSKASFNDLNLIVSHQINKNNSLYLTGYLSRDHFNLNSDTTYGYGNSNVSLKWKHIYNNKLNQAISIGYDKYEYELSSNRIPVNAFHLAFDIRQSNFKWHFNYYLNSKHTFDFGLSSIYYQLHPGSLQPDGPKSLVVSNTVSAEQALESGIYLTDQYTISSKLSLNAGIRYSIFNYLGPQTVYSYAPGVPREISTIIDSTHYGKNKIINTYKGPEYRIAARYAFSESFSMKAGFNSLRQYIQVISNTAAITPIDIWKLSDPNIKPQYGEQYSLGFYKNLKSNTIETSLEVYYKRILDYLDYKSGAQLVLNHHLETDVINTKGKAYGVEMMIKKLTGKVNGWISYTYSRILLKMDDPAAGELINKGNYYPANYDIPSSVTLVGNYRLSHRYSFSLNATYSTGRPITLPIAIYYYNGSQRALYSDRNAYRIPDYFRTDIAFNVDGNHKVKQKTHTSWNIGVYNLTGRRNPYSVYFISENGVVKGYKFSIFGNAIPFINFNIRFN